MQVTPQTENQSVLQHGLSVQRYTFDLLNHLRSGTPLKYQWRLPEWLEPNKEFILNSLTTDYNISLYTKLHDIGKPFCIEYDAEGKRHYPKHAQKSYEVFKENFANPIVADLILHDMDIHTLKADQVATFTEQPNCITSLVVGLAEMHSNAAMFGGIESDSFKIKNKKITQAGKRIFNSYISN